MAEKLKIIPLGGLNEIGKNMTAYEYGGEIIVVDCGMAFPGDDMYGIDLIIPDVSYLIKNRARIRGLFITHGHEDHVGAIPYVLKQLNMPIYCTRFTAGLIKLKLEEHGLVKSTKLITVEPGKSVRAGKFTVEFIHVNHSIADSVAFAIHTHMGTIVHTGDFKIDSTPIDGEVIDLARFGALGKEGVLALLADSTNVERPGYTMSERLVGKTFQRQFTGCKQRIIVTTFASNVHRIQQIIDAAAACGRKVAVTGRSMENIMKVSTELGYMKIPKGVLMDINRIKGLPPQQQVIITTGSQGEEMSALYRMAFSTHKQIDIGPQDKVIISASAIPGNEVTVGRVINELFRKGATVVYDRADMLHVSGHACQEELKIIHANHSIADAVCFAIKCGVGTVVHTGDFKIDPTPIQGGMMDLGRLGQLGKEGVLALLADSTNVERPGFTKSERSVGDSFDALFRGCQQRIIVTTFASNVDRIQQIIDVAARYGRKVAVTGRSMENAMKVSTELGYMNIPDGVLVDLAHIKSLPKHKICIITTGSQGETMSALTRMAFNTHRQVEIQAGDRVILSASAVPGNEVTVGRVINELFRKGATVVYDRADMLHVSGHACQE
uniref:ribonuclease J n=1 Tax=Dysosmobacter welbionis TaxID=2093857 RepID=UPI003FEFF01B